MAFIDPDHLDDIKDDAPKGENVKAKDLTPELAEEYRSSKSPKKRHAARLALNKTWRERFKSAKQGLKSFAAGAYEGAMDVAEGVGTAGAAAGEFIGLLPEGSEESVKETFEGAELPVDAKYKDSTAYEAGKFIGGTAPYAAIPGGAVGGLARRAATGALSGGAIGATQPVPEDGSRLQQAGLGAALGGTLAPALGALGKGYRAATGKSSAISAAKGIDKRIDLGPEDIATAKKADDLGTFLTPGEVSGSKSQLGKEARMMLSPKTKKELTKKLEERGQILSNKVKKSLDDMAPEGTKQKINELYKKAGDEVLPPEVISKLRKDPILQKQIKILEKDPDFALETLEPNTISYFNEVKKGIDARIFSKTGERAVKGSTSATKNLKDVKNNLIKAMDEASPTYKEARAAAQRVKIKEKYLSDIDSIKIDPATGEVPIKGVFNKLAGTTAKKRAFLDDVKATGGNVQQAKDVLDVMQRVDLSDLNQLLKNQDELFSKFSLGQGPLGLATGTTGQLFYRKQHKALLDIITDPKWASKLGELKKAHPTKATLGLSKILRASAIDSAIGEEDTPLDSHYSAPSAPRQEKPSFIDPDQVNIDEKASIEPATGTSKLPLRDTPTITKDVMKSITRADKPISAQLPESVVKQVQKSDMGEYINMTPNEYYENVVKDPKFKEQLIKRAVKLGRSPESIYRAFDEIEAIEAEQSKEIRKPGERPTKSTMNPILQIIVALLFGTKVLFSMQKKQNAKVKDWEKDVDRYNKELLKQKKLSYAKKSRIQKIRSEHLRKK